MDITIISKDHSDIEVYKISTRKIFGSNCIISHFDEISDFINSSESKTSKILLVNFHQLQKETADVKEKFQTAISKKAAIYILDLDEVNYLDRSFLLPENFVIRENLSQKTFETVLWRAIKHKLIKREYSQIYEIVHAKSVDFDA